MQSFFKAGRLFFLIIVLIISPVLVISSCASSKPTLHPVKSPIEQKEQYSTFPPAKTVEKTTIPNDPYLLTSGAEDRVLLAQLPPVNPRQELRHPIPEKIMGMGKVSASALASFLIRNNPRVGYDSALDLAAAFIEEALDEGVNADVAFCQMCVETGFLNFGGLVTPDMNNFAGLGSTGPGQRGERFPSMRIGVRAQIQHLKAYASTEKPNKPLVDTRYKYVRYGSATTISELSGKWAADTTYASKINSVLERLYGEQN